MRITSPIIFFLFYSVIGFGQTQVIDSLKSLLTTSESHEKEIDILNEISYNFNHISLDSTLLYATEALEKANTHNYLLGKARALNLQSIKSLYDKKHDKSLAINYQALELAKEVNDHAMLSKIFNTIGINYYNLGDQENCLVNLREALQQSELARDTNVTIIIGSNIGYMHLKNNELELAEQYLERADYLNSIFTSRIGVSSVSKHLATLYGLQGKDEKAIQYFTESLARAKKENDNFSLGWNHLQLGKFQKNRKEYQKAITNLQLAKQYFQERKDLENQLQVYSELSEVLNNQKNFIKAKSFAAIGLELADGEGDILHKKNLYKQLSLSQEGLDDYKSAYLSHKAYKQWNDSLLVVDKSEKVIELETLHQLEKSKVENQLLKEEQAKTDAIISQSRIQNIATLIILGFISAIAFLLFRNNKRKQEYSSQLELEVEQRTKDLTVTNKQLLESNEELERFAFIASHDLKEPIRNIMSFTDLLKKELSSIQNEKAHKFINIIHRNTDQLYLLVRDTLEFSLLSNQEKKLETVNLNETIESVKSSIADTISKSNAEILLETKLPEVKANKTQMFLLFKNLIENGLKYNTSDNPKIKITFNAESDKDSFIITDNGIGIENKYTTKIFDMFSRLQKREGWEGTGLGLATCKKIINQMGGKIWVDSKIGEGSRFHFTLPSS